MAVVRSCKMKQVLDVIDRSKTCTAKDICDELGMDTKEVGGMLKQLRLRGLVRIVESKSHSGNVWGLA